ncbi:MAG: filamentous hemagglutinin N-terminal domain-containing protein [Elainellaceae cyanobacterium]
MHVWTLRRLISHLLVSSVGISVVIGGEAIAQNITLDGSLSSPRALDGPNYIIRVEDGQVAGRNLFHSFGRFNLDAREIATFLSNPNIRNIIGRVSGGDASTIDGTIRTLAQGSVPNVFLINPNGIIFGETARLDVGGSFIATTADALQFGDRGMFDARNLNANPALLTIDPSAFLFNQMGAQPIVNQSIAPNRITFQAEGLRVPANQSLLLVGGDVILDGGYLTAQGGQVELAGIAETGSVGLVLDESMPRLTVPAGIERSDIIVDRGTVNVTGDTGGIALQGRNIRLFRGGTLRAGVVGLGIGSSGNAGDIDVNATETLTIRGILTPTPLGGIQNLSFGVDGQAGDIRVTAQTIRLNGAQLATSSLLSDGGAGTIRLRASDSIVVRNNAVVQASSLGAGSPGEIELQAGQSIRVADSILSTGTLLGESQGGDMTIRAGDRILFQRSQVISQAANVPQSDAFRPEDLQSGNIRIQGRSLSFQDNTLISSSTTGFGDAGRIDLVADNDIQLLGSFIASVVGETGIGNGGNVRLRGRSLRVTDGGEVQTLTRGTGNAGAIEVNMSESVDLIGVRQTEGTISDLIPPLLESAGPELATLLALLGIDINDLPTRAQQVVPFSSGLFSGTEPTAEGRGGEILVNTGTLRVTNGAVLSARTRNASEGGTIRVNATTLDVVNGGQILTTAFRSGNAGDITLNISDRAVFAGQDPTFSERLTDFGPSIVDGDGANSGVRARTRGTGQAGDVAIATDILQVLDGADLNVSGRSGEAGNLNITANQVRLDQGRLTASTGVGTGGNVDVQSRDALIARNNSLISAAALEDANGGNVAIETDFVISVLSENSDIIANAVRGDGGNIDITAQGIFGIEPQPQLTPNSDINASSEFGVDGVIVLNTPDVDPIQGTVELPSEPETATISQGCSSDVADGQSEFVTAGRGGLPLSPTDLLDLDDTQANWLHPESVESEIPTSTGDTPEVTAPDSLPTEAQGWVVQPNGTVILTTLSSFPSSLPWQYRVCQGATFPPQIVQ